MQARLHPLPHDLPLQEAAPDGAALLPAPWLQFAMWAAVLALTVLSYSAHVAGIRGGDIAGNVAGSLFAGVDAGVDAQQPGATAATGSSSASKR